MHAEASFKQFKEFSMKNKLCISCMKHPLVERKIIKISLSWMMSSCIMISTEVWDALEQQYKNFIHIIIWDNQQVSFPKKKSLFVIVTKSEEEWKCIILRKKHKAAHNENKLLMFFYYVTFQSQKASPYRDSLLFESNIE
jgi:hypothetical protein